MREKIVTSRESLFHRMRLLPLVVILIMANVIWAPEGHPFDWWWNRGTPITAEISIYIMSNDNPEDCAKGEFIGSLPIYHDRSFVAKASGHRGLYPQGRGKGRGKDWDSFSFFWESQLTDKTTSYCGIVNNFGVYVVGTEDVIRTLVEGFEDEVRESSYLDTEPLQQRFVKTEKTIISTPDLLRLRGVIILDAEEPALKLTIRGYIVKVEPLHACCSTDEKGAKKCSKDGILWKSEACPEGSISAGKTSSCKKCFDKEESTSKETPVPSTGHPPDSAKRACCVDGSCKLGTADECQNMGGTFIPDKATCTPDPCPEVKTGCCLDGKCVNLLLSECGMRYGEPLNRLCRGNDEEDCENLTGACMVGTKCVPSQTRSGCEQYLSGKYQGNGTRCPPTPQVPKGACCFDGKCSFETQAGCSAKGDSAVFLPGKTCDPNPCQQPEPPKGGCCDIFGKCEENVSEAECLLRQDARFFPDGCPGTCPPVEGACYVPCALAPSVMDCSTVSIRECAAKNNARFEPNKKCPDPDIKTCENCGPCEQAYATGEWFLTLQDEKGELTLLSDCKATMVMEKLGGDRATNLPTAQSPIIRREGKWHCSGENVIVDFDGVKSTLVINKERATPRLCYRDGGKLICAERKPPPDETLFVISVGGIGASPDWAGKSLVQSGSHEEIFRLKRGQDLRTELEAYHRRLLGDVCEIVNPPGMISKDAPPQIFNWAEITVLTGPITDVKQLKGRSLKDTWKTINENGISLGELRKRGGCGN